MVLVLLFFVLQNFTTTEICFSLNKIDTGMVLGMITGRWVTLLYFGLFYLLATAQTWSGAPLNSQVACYKRLI